MYKVVSFSGSTIGVLDTADGVTEYYTRPELHDILSKYDVEIEGCFCGSEGVRIYKSQDVLFKGGTYRLIADTDSGIVYVVVRSVSFIELELTLTLKFSRFLSVSDSIRTKKAGLRDNFDFELLTHCCRKAQEVNDSLFIDFGRVLLEIYREYHSLATYTSFKTILLERSVET